MNRRASSFAVVAALCLSAHAIAADARWPDLSKTPSLTADGSRDAAVIVGIENYLAVPKVKGATKNATDWYRFLVEGRKVPTSRVHLLRDKEAAREAILKALDQAAGEVERGGTVWVVFVGHGAPSRDQAQGMLVGFDAQQTPDSLEARSVRQAEIAERLRQGGQANAIAILDACFSGRAGLGQALAPGLQPLVAARVPASAAITTLVAAAGNEYAGPLPTEGRPAFSYLVLGALRGWGDTNRDGRVTAREAVDYAQRALFSLPLGRSQTPELSGPNQDVVLAAGASESGPSLQDLVASASSAFGEGLGSIVAIPELAPLPEFQAPEASYRDADVDLLRKKQNALRAEKDTAVGFIDKEASWGLVAAHPNPNPLREAAIARRAEWERVRVTEQRRAEQHRKMCDSLRRDAAKLDELLKLDDEVLPPARKTSYRDELGRVYASYPDTDRCEVKREYVRIIDDARAPVDKGPYWTPARTWGWSAVGAGVAFAGAGLGLAMRSREHADMYDRYCNETACDPRAQVYFDDAKSLATWATGAYVLGGAALATGAWLLIAPPTSMTNAPTARVVVAPSYVGLSGEF
jgi:hypothetical protein